MSNIKKASIILTIFSLPVLWAEVKEEALTINPNPAQPNGKQDKPLLKGKKEFLTGVFKKLDNGKVSFTTSDNKNYILVKGKYEQVGEEFDKPVIIICKTKPFKTKDGSPLIVHINKLKVIPTVKSDE